MLRRAVAATTGFLFAIAALNAQEAPKSLTFTQEAVTFSAPNNYSPIRIVRLRFHPTEPKLIAQVSDKQLAVWDLNGKPQTLKGKKEPTVLPEYHAEQKEGWVTSFDVHPQGQWLVTGGSDRKLRKWSWRDKSKAAVEVEGSQGWIEALAYSPDGKSLASAGSDLQVRIWNADSLKQLAVYIAHTRPIRDLAWSPDGQFLYTGGEDGKILIYDVATAKIVRVLDFGNVNEQQGQDPAQSGVFRLSVHREGRWLSVAGQNKLGLFDLKTGNLVAVEPLGFDTLFYPDSRIVLGGFNDLKVMRLDPSKLEKIALDPSGKKGKATSPVGDALTILKRNNGYGLAVHPDGTRVAAAIGESSIGLWNVKRK